MRVIRQAQNRGVAAARNRILEEAAGEFIAFFDDDDESHAARIAAQIDRLVTYERKFAKNAPVICHTARRQRYPNGTVRIAPTMGQAAHRAAPHGMAVAQRILLGRPLVDGYGALATCSQLGRRETYLALGGFDESYRRGEDTDFAIRLAKANGHFPGIGTPLVNQSMTLSADKGIRDDQQTMQRLIKKHRDVFANDAEFDFAREFAEARCDWLLHARGSAFRRLARLSATHPLLAVQRLAFAMQGLEANRSFRRFHTSGAG